MRKHRFGEDYMLAWSRTGNPYVHVAGAPHLVYSIDAFLNPSPLNGTPKQARKELERLLGREWPD
jgi:hypothetical protein